MDKKKLLDLDKEPIKTFKEYRYKGVSDEKINKYGIPLYHGIRFDPLERLESIFQSGSILCGKRIKETFTSYDGTVKNIYVYNDEENCNMGKYVSVMPYTDSYEFDIFVRSNLFFGIKATIDAFKTIHLSYDDYIELRESGIKCNNLYSYAFNEYLVKDEIPLDDVLFIGIDSNYYNGNYEDTVNKVIELMKIYNIKLPFIDVNNNIELYCYNNKTRNKIK